MIVVAKIKMDELKTELGKCLFTVIALISAIYSLIDSHVKFM